MKWKVSTRDLKLGMYVVELDRPWVEAPFEPPFDIQGFTLRTVEHLEKVKQICRYVYIDPDIGVAADRYLPEYVGPETIARILDSVPPRSGGLVYEDTLPVEQEMSAARQILNDASDVYDHMVADIQAGRAIDTQSVKKVVGALVESVLRNPAAVSWLVQLKHKDESAYSQSISVAVLAATVGRFLGLAKDELETLSTAALLMDIGKIHLPAKLLAKPARFTHAERDTMRKHVNFSVAMLLSAGGFGRRIMEIVASHHERYDGGGYPRRLSGGQIDVGMAIAGLSDTYVAMTSKRPYRAALTSFEALMELYQERDRAFPGAVVEQFIQCIGIFPVGSFVQLNTKEVGIVVHRNRVQQLKPKVMILVGPAGARVSPPQTIDLAAQYLPPGATPRTVARVVDPHHFELDPTEFFA